MKLVILAAGMGSRYGGLKQLDPITDNGEFIIDFSVFDAVRAGFDEIIFIIKKENLELFKETVGERISSFVKVTYAFQGMDSCLPEGFKIPEGREKPWGTGHALLCAREAVGNDAFVVINADDYYGSTTFSEMASFLKSVPLESPSYCMAGFVLKNTLTENGSVSRGICTLNEKSELTDVVERTKILRENGNTVYYEDGISYPTDENGYVSMNCWGFTPSAFEYLREDFNNFLSDIDSTPDPKRAEFYLPLMVSIRIKKNDCTVKVIPTEEKWYGVTYSEDKPKVKESIKSLMESGKYPITGLWSK